MIRKQSSHIPMAALVVVGLVGLAAAVSTSSVVAGASSSVRAQSAAGLPPRPHLDPVSPAAPGSSPRPSGAKGSSPWSALANPPPFTPEAMLVTTNGTVMVQQYQTGNWWRLTPSKSGSYVEGTWSHMGSLPTGYAPEYYGSAVLPDGRVVIMGGEYNGAGGPPADHGAIYNPVTNKWARVNPPAGWTGIGDAQTVVLANGQLMLAQALQKIGSNIYCGGSECRASQPDHAHLDGHRYRQSNQRRLSLRRAGLDAAAQQQGADRGHVENHAEPPTPRCTRRRRAHGQAPATRRPSWGLRW